MIIIYIIYSKTTIILYIILFYTIYPVLNVCQKNARLRVFAAFTKFFCALI